MGLGDRLRFYRVSRQWSQKELARRSRIAAEQINRYEKEHTQPRVATIVRLARALGVSLSDLLCD